MSPRTSQTEMARERYIELKRILEDRRREILNEVQEKMRDVRAVGASGEGVLDDAESSEADIQDDIELALIQTKSETLHKIEEALARLGRPFEQVESQLTKSHHGSGLGLAIAKSLVELHGGCMRIRSTLGKGTLVMVRLPLHPHCPLPKEEAA